MTRFLSTATVLVVGIVLFAASLKAGQAKDPRDMSKSHGSHQGTASGSKKIGFDPDGALPWPKRQEVNSMAGKPHEDEQDDADFWETFLG